jgi:hypothetical protein
MKSHHGEKRVCERVNLAKGKINEDAVVPDMVSLANYHIYLKMMIDGKVSRPFSAETMSFIGNIPELEHVRDITAPALLTG